MAKAQTHTARHARRRPNRQRGARRRRKAAWRPHGLRLHRLDQRQIDLLGLGLVALGVFFAFVFYLSWDGGKIGEALAIALRWLFGAVAYLVPVALFAIGAALVLRPLLPSLAPFKAGGLCLAAGLMLGFATQAFGLGPDHPARGEPFDNDFISAHGGAAGEALWYAATTLFQRAGAVLLFVFLIVAGVILLTGASVAGVLRATGGAVAGTGARMKESTQEFVTVVGAKLKRREVDEQAEDQADWARPEHAPPVGGTIAAGGGATAADELARGHGTVAGEPPQLDGAERYPDLFRPTVVERDGEIAARVSTDEGPPAIKAGPDTDTGTVVSGAPGKSAGSEAPDLAAAAKGGQGELELTPQGNVRSGVTVGSGRDYRLPDPKVLKRSQPGEGQTAVGRKETAAQLVETLGHFGVEARAIGMVTGPSVTRYELRLAPGTKVGKVAQLKDDLAYALASTEIRILAPIPGKQAVGVEVPNPERRIVHLGDIYRTPPKGASPLAVWLGKDIAGNAVWTDLAQMPHILVAGTTGSGKSGCINTMLCSILLRSTPDQVRLVLVDPKQVELNYYETLPHLLTPVVSSPRMAANVLGNLIKEMQARYDVLQEARCRNLPELNRKRVKEGEPPLPYILCVIDELADLMMLAPAEVENTVIRLAQRSRAVGLHLLFATQRPSTDVITGTIKVNVPARIAFAVSSQVDSRVILDQGGAEALLGQGDMLFRPVGTSRLQRIQGGYVTEEEVARLVEAWDAQGEPEYRDELLQAAQDDQPSNGGEELSPDEDELLEEAIALVVQTQTASVSMLQRRLRVGYTRAGRLIDMLERRGIISGYEGSKPREVLVPESDVDRVLAENGGSGRFGVGRSEPVTIGGGADSETGSPDE